MTPFTPVATTVEITKPISDSLYGYSSGQIEPVVHIIEPEKDWIVRNSYGALIWVSRSTVILDIDDDDSHLVRFGAAVISNTLEQLGWKYRLYKTCNGYRVIIVGIDAESSVREGSPFWDAIQRLPVDVNYKQLCHKQRCFRARLSTKPWRTNELSLVPTNPIGANGVSVDPDAAITRLIIGSFEINDESSDGAFPALHLHDVITGGISRSIDGVDLA